MEFALLAPILLALIFSAFEIGLLFTRIALLDRAIADVSRAVYTGRVASSSVSRMDLVDTVCDVVGWVTRDCVNNTTIEMRVITSLAAIPSDDAECVDASVSITPAVRFDATAPSDIVFARVCVTTDLLTPGLGLGLALARTATGRYELISSDIFVNEPF